MTLKSPVSLDERIVYGGEDIPFARTVFKPKTASELEGVALFQEWKFQLNAHAPAGEIQVAANQDRSYHGLGLRVSSLEAFEPIFGRTVISYDHIWRIFFGHSILVLGYQLHQRDLEMQLGSETHLKSYISQLPGSKPQQYESTLIISLVDGARQQLVDNRWQ